VLQSPTWVFEGDEARMPQNDPSHADASQPVDCWDRVAAHAPITDCEHIPPHGERQHHLRH
jgi:hypothetical protein